VNGCLKLAVIIVTYNDMELIGPCLRSVFENKADWAYGVWVIDNGSRDGTVAFIQRNFPMVQVVENHANLGYTQANNIGIKCTRSEYILLLNPDTVLPTDALVRAISEVDRNEDIGVLGPKLIRPNGSLDFACRRMFPSYLDFCLLLLGLARKFPRSRILGHYNLTYLDANQMADVDSVAGAFLLARRSAVEDVGLLDEAFFIYGDDIDWCYRFRLRGWRVLYFPQITVMHRKGGTSRRTSGPLIFQFYRSNTLLYNKHVAGRTFILLNLIMYLLICLKFVLSYSYNLLLPQTRKRVA